MPGEPGLEILGDRIFIEIFQRKLVTQPMGLKFAFYTFQRVVTNDYIHRSIGADDHKARKILTSRQIGDQLKCGVIAPMQILQNQQQGRFRGKGLNGLSHFAKHPLTGCSGNLRSQRFSLRLRHQGGHLRQPGGRLLSQYVEHPGSIRGTAKPGKSIENRQIGFSRTILLQALPSRHTESRDSNRLFQEGLDNRGLPDSRFPGNEDGLTISGESPLQPASHFG